MRNKLALMSMSAFTGLAVLSADVAAETALEKAIKAGAKQLTSGEIAKLIVGKTVTAALGKKRFLFHYSANNVISGRMIGGKWSDTGYYGITDDNRVCLSMSKSDKGMLRCLTLAAKDGAVTKYRANGSASFKLLKFEDGKAF